MSHPIFFCVFGYCDELAAAAEDVCIYEVEEIVLAKFVIMEFKEYGSFAPCVSHCHCESCE